MKIYIVWDCEGDEPIGYYTSKNLAYKAATDFYNENVNLSADFPDTLAEYLEFHIDLEEVDLVTDGEQ